MRLALIIDDYLPLSTRVGAKMFHELALSLIDSGHQVTVITPDAEIKKSLVIVHVDGVEVWKFRSGAIKDIGKIKRAINESLLSYLGWKAIKNQVSSATFEGVIYYSPSIFFGGLVRRIKDVCDCPAYLVLRDFFPQWSIDAGMIKPGSLVELYFRYFERQSYQVADMIGVMSESNKDIFESSFKKEYPVEVLRNWASLLPHRSTNNIREVLNLENKVIFFYGGNIGHAQDMANLIRLAINMRDYKDAHFLFVGQGDEVELILDMARKSELENFSYLSSVDQEEFKNILSCVDVGLFSLSPKHTTHNFPGKLLGYMVQSIPILGSVNKNNDLLKLVNDNFAGSISVNGEDDLLLENAIYLYQNPEQRVIMGNNGYHLLSKEFSVGSAEKCIISKLLKRKYDESIKV